MWHSTSTESECQILEALESTRAPLKVREQNAPASELLDGANLSNIEFPHDMSLIGVSCRGANFKDVNFSGMDFSESVLIGSNFSDSSLWRADFSKTDLRDADLSEASLSETTFFKSDLRGAKVPGDSDELDDFPMWGDFTGADLRGVTFPFDLRYSNMSKAFFMREPLDFDPERGFKNQKKYYQTWGNHHILAPLQMI